MIQSNNAVWYLRHLLQDLSIQRKPVFHFPLYYMCLLLLPVTHIEHSNLPFTSLTNNLVNYWRSIILLPLKHNFVYLRREAYQTNHPNVLKQCFAATNWLFNLNYVQVFSYVLHEITSNFYICICNQRYSNIIFLSYILLLIYTVAFQ